MRQWTLNSFAGRALTMLRETIPAPRCGWLNICTPLLPMFLHLAKLIIHAVKINSTTAGNDWGLPVWMAEDLHTASSVSYDKLFWLSEETTGAKLYACCFGRRSFARNGGHRPACSVPHTISNCRMNITRCMYASPNPPKTQTRL
jgi:hypothetical protein